MKWYKVLVSKIIFYKYISFGLLTFYTFFQFYIYNNSLYKNDYAVMVFIQGLGAYLAFFDLGLTKPIYANLREKFIQNNLSKGDFLEAFNLYFGLLLVLIFFFPLMTLFALKFLKFDYSIDLVTISLILLVISFNAFFTFIREVFYALNYIVLYEKYDIIRKFVLISSVSTIYYDHSFRLYIIIQMIFFILSLAVFTKFFFKNYLCDVNNIFHIVSFISIKSHIEKYYNNFLYKFNESLTYNIGYFLVPVIFGQYQVILFGVFLKIFMGFSSISRIFPESYIHQLTKNFFSRNIQNVKKDFHKSLLYGVLVFLMAYIIFLFLNNYVLSFLLPKDLYFDNETFIALGILGLFNVLQHTSGVFLLSTKEYIFLKKTSLFILLLNITIFFVVYIFTFTLNDYLLGYSVLYSIGSVIYLLKAKKVIG